MLRARHLTLAARFARHRLRPLHVFEIQAQLTNKCGRRCVYCRCPETGTDLLPTGEWLALIRRLPALGCLRVKFQGGEPTIHPDFRELSAATQAAGMIAAVVTHGGAIAAAPDLLDHIDELVVSLDSPERAANDAQRGLGSHAGATAAIEEGVRRRLRTVVNMILTRGNLSHLEKMLEYCEARGVLMNAQPAVFGRRYYDDAGRAVALSPEQIREAHRTLARWRRAGRGVLFSARAYEKALGWHDLEELAVCAAGGGRCPAGRDFAHVDPNGDISPCIQTAADFRPLNLVRDGLEAALRHARRHDCADCWPAYLTERRLLFSLHPGAVLEVLRRG